MSFLKKMVTGVAVAVLVFTAGGFVASCCGKTIQPEFVDGFYKLCGGEGVLLFLIKKFCG